MKNTITSLFLLISLIAFIACNKKIGKREPVVEGTTSQSLVEKKYKTQNKSQNKRDQEKDKKPLKQDLVALSEAEIRNSEASPKPLKREMKKMKRGRLQKSTRSPMARQQFASGQSNMMRIRGGASFVYAPPPRPVDNTESYEQITENGFKKVTSDPLSTFSIDVDVASYANMRRFITGNKLPPVDAVRIEEMINYFDYDYPQPKGKQPFSINAEYSDCPWNAKHKLLHVGLQGLKIDATELPPANLVFLLDVSGSMSQPNKLPLLKKALGMLVKNLRKKDKVSIVVYAGAAGVVLPPTSGNQQRTIIEALERLNAGGSTAGGAGIKLAYNIAKENFIPTGNNRVILATDGDFNIGASSDKAMTKLIEEKRKLGIFLTVLGFGMGNYKDSKMEKLADKGNGNYAYIDNLMEAKKVLVNEIGSTLFTIAKDVKIQVEFNPKAVSAYRLIGYENRMLAAKDFNDDKKDAGELGAGHTVTALYEIVPPGVEFEASVDPLKYQKVKKTPEVYTGFARELLTVKFRYKLPRESKSKLIVKVIKNHKIPLAKASDNFKFSAAVAGMGMLLRQSEYKGSLSMENVIKLAKESKGKDDQGYRAEFIRLTELAQILQAQGDSYSHNNIR